ncbi:MAG TPA: copper chaperone PCu(A)C [Azospirillaceae bacterium]|nr:copper chaperone PCu(A)C [Azospirillaceae bacterium]
MIRRAFLLTAALAALAGGAAAHSFGTGAVQIGHPWALPSEGPQASAFVSLLNKGGAADRFVGADTDVAEKVVIHDLVQGKPAPVAGMDLAPNRPVALRPTARELRLEGLKRPLKLGERFMMTLRFEKAAPVKVEVFVEDGQGGH